MGGAERRTDGGGREASRGRRAPLREWREGVASKRERGEGRVALKKAF